MRRRLLPILIPLAVGCNLASERGGRIGPVPEFAEAARALDAFVGTEVAQKQLGATVIALVDDQRIIYSRGFGRAHLADSAASTAQTVFPLGTLGSFYVDLALLQAVERGRVVLDTPVTVTLPEFRPANRWSTPVTIRHLLAGRSGLVRELPHGALADSNHVTLGDGVASASVTALAWAPGTRSKESNAARATLALVLERAHGASVQVAVQAAVLQPLGLAGTHYGLDSVARSGVAEGEGWSYIGRTFQAPQQVDASWNALYGTIPDVARVLRALLAGGAPLLQPATVASLWEAPQADPEGDGLLFRADRLEGRRMVRRVGSAPGFALEMAALPGERLGVVVAVARDGASATTGRIATEALRVLLAAKTRRPLPAAVHTTAVPLALARQAEGSYGVGDSAFAIVRYDSTLSLRRARGGNWLRLGRLAGDTLVADDVLGFGDRVIVAGDGRVDVGSGVVSRSADAALPAEPRATWRGLVGEYGTERDPLIVYEGAGRLRVLVERFHDYPLRSIVADSFAFPDAGRYAGEQLRFTRDASGQATSLVWSGRTIARRVLAGEDGSVFRITPVAPVDSLRQRALAASPPVETGDSLPSDLVELVQLDPSIRLDIRYASDRNFLSTPVYTQARAFLQRPAAEALVRAHRRLKAHGYGLLIHDGYRPWYVTRMFWDGTPPDKHAFVADPGLGSKHNRGGAVDLTMFELRTGKPVVMTGGYDEMSDRSYPDYPGGTSRQRALRELLRAAMEAEGFRVYEAEWWHFDWKDWRKYRIGNRRFEELHH